jgi:hypothetical protein
MYRVPKNIFCFWHDKDNVPPFVMQCLQNIQRLHQGRGWTVTVLSDEDLPSRSERPDIWVLAEQHRADWIRLQKLSENGGIWLDATCIVYRPLDEWLPMSTKAVVVGYAYPHCHEARILENWLLIAPVGSPFIAEWCAEFDKAVRRGLGPYVKDVGKAGALPPPGLALPYHAMHVAGWVVMQRHSKWKYDIRDAVPIGPLGSLAACGYPWGKHRVPCIKHFIRGTTLRAECGDTMTKLCCGLWDAIQDAWQRGDMQRDNQIAEQLGLFRRKHRHPVYVAIPSQRSGKASSEKRYRKNKTPRRRKYRKGQSQ